MRIIPAPALDSANNAQMAALLGTINELSAEIVRLKSEAGKVQVRQVIVDRKVDNPALLETIDSLKKQVEALEKARLNAQANRSAIQTVVKEVQVPQIVDRIIFRLPKWVVPTLLGGSVVMLMLGVLIGMYAGKP